MIPYDDLVAALSAWRARQGLPVSALGGGGSGATAQVGSGPHASPGSGPNRGMPPAPGSGRTKQPSMPPPMAAMATETHDDALDVDDAAMLEEHYENEGDDFAMAFNPNAPAAGDGDDSTSIGGAPAPNERNDRDDW